MNESALEDFRRMAKFWLEQERRAQGVLSEQTCSECGGPYFPVLSPSRAVCDTCLTKEFYGKHFTIEEGEDGLMVTVDDPCQRLMWEET